MELVLQPSFSVDHPKYRESLLKQAPRFAAYPRTVSIETLVRCNAKCGFCPYPSSSRKGTRLDDALFEKIVDDLRGIPRRHKFGFTMARINEPLLDPRLEAFTKLVAKQLPNASHTFWSNGTTLKPGRFEWMSDVKESRLMVSLNSVDAVEHRQLMGFGTDVVFRNLDHLHALAVAGEFKLPVTLCAPYISNARVAEYQRTCSERWPLFRTTIRPFFQWMGDIPAGRDERDSHRPDGAERSIKSGELGCGQWFDLHILANGYATKCCIDETGFDDERFDASRRNVLDIYKESLPLRQTMPGRDGVAGCIGCTHLG